jgi:hypothetical protein
MRALAHSIHAHVSMHGPPSCFESDHNADNRPDHISAIVALSVGGSFRAFWLGVR